MTKQVTPPSCPYCGAVSVLLMNSAELYWSGRNYGPMYVCRPCGAWVGCHDGTTNPLGRLANAELREWKQRVHKAFDPFWQRKFLLMKFRGEKDASKSKARNAGYAWLADQLGIPREECHVGMFDVDLCKRAIEVCNQFRRQRRNAA